jgi:hypothetical protein
LNQLRGVQRGHKKVEDAIAGSHGQPYIKGGGNIKERQECYMRLINGRIDIREES